MLSVGCSVTVFLLPGPVFCVVLRKLPGERRLRKIVPDFETCCLRSVADIIGFSLCF